MPSRAASSEGTRPGRALRDAPPQSEVELRAPARIVEARVELDHRRDLPGGVRHRIRFAPVEATHVPEKGALLAPTQLAPADLIPRGTLQDGLVDVRDVLGIPHALSAYLQEAREHVEDEERAGVTQVRGV